MSEKPPSRKDLLRPLQLLGLAFVAAVFAGGVTLVSMGFFQRTTDQAVQALTQQQALVTGAIVAGVTFIVVLVMLALLLLAVDPAQVAAPLDRPVLLPKDDPDAAAPGSSAASGSTGDAPAGDEPPRA
jgi:hypothetical protein